MNCYILLLCFIAVPTAFGNTSNAQSTFELEPDRARSAWNFGGGGGGNHPLKRAVFLNRRKNVAGPGSIIADRRMGSGNAPMAPYRIKSKSPSKPQWRRQNSPYPNPTQQGRPVIKRHANFPFSSQSSSAFPQSYPRPYSNYQQGTPASSWQRLSRNLRPTVDSIKSRFMKEDLWHLDKGESYTVKDEDLVRDNLLRNHNYETNEIDHEEIVYLNQLEKDAEKMINQEEMVVNSTENKKTPHHIHHHHHYEFENNATHSKKELQKKKPTDNSQKLLPVPSPRIHNPIPLGCILAVPVLHPIRPRNHLACLLSIPGTPNLLKKRRKRSADLPQVDQQTQAQAQNMFQQIFGTNSRMTPVVTRKHYSNHVGNGKNPNPSAPGAQQSFKVPATIIAPPKFNQDDVLTMLLGSGGINADKLGTVVATNNRYVRYGRGLPNGRDSGRQGRTLKWSTESNKINQSPVPVKTQTPVTSSSHHIPKVVKVPSQFKSVKAPPTHHKIVKKPVVQLTPPSSPYLPLKTYPQPPVILNVQISPLSSSRVPNGPIITVPVQQQPKVLEKQQPPHNIEQILQSNTDKSPPQEPNNTKQQEQEKPITEEQHQQQHWIMEHLHQRMQQLNAEQLNQKNQQHEESTTEHPQQQVEQLPTAPFQMVSVSALEDNENLKYPPQSKTSKHQNSYNYDDILHMNIEPSESKQFHQKVKVAPFLYPHEKEVNNPFTSYEDNNSQFFDSSSFANSVSTDNGNYVSDPSSVYSSWTDNQVNNDNRYNNNYDQSISYAKKNNYKDELDALDDVLQEISNRERGIYSDAQLAENYYDRNTYDDINRFVSGSSSSSSKSDDVDNSRAYSQEKYYSATRVPEQLPDPIIIEVPKENRFSNELYDV